MSKVFLNVSKQFESFFQSLLFQLRQSIKDLRIDDEKLESQLYLYHWMRGEQKIIVLHNSNKFKTEPKHKLTC